jgi:hypothetical protein
MIMKWRKIRVLRSSLNLNHQRGRRLAFKKIPLVLDALRRHSQYEHVNHPVLRLGLLGQTTDITTPFLSLMFTIDIVLYRCIIAKQM